MRDLTREMFGDDPISALIPTSQAGGNQVTSLVKAHTAPGSQPSTPFTSLKGETIDHPPPVVEHEDHVPPVLRDADGHHVNPDNADRSTPFDQPDGAGWNTAGDISDVLPETRGKPSIKLGRWNEV